MHTYVHVSAGNIVLCNVFTPTRKMLDFKNASQ